MTRPIHAVIVWNQGRQAKAREKHDALTSSELIVPSSTTCVLTIAFPSNAQNVAATKPAWTAVMAVRAVEPCSRKDPVVMSWRGRVTR